MHCGGAMVLGQVSTIWRDFPVDFFRAFPTGEGGTRRLRRRLGANKKVMAPGVYPQARSSLVCGHFPHTADGLEPRGGVFGTDRHCPAAKTQDRLVCFFLSFLFLFVLGVTTQPARVGVSEYGVGTGLRVRWTH